MIVVSVTIVDEVYEAAEVLANQLGISRSNLYTRALKYYLEECREASLEQNN